MKKKRVKKKGLFYVLKSDDLEGNLVPLAKYGCTSSNLYERIAWANKSAKRIFGGVWDFEVVEIYRQKDIYWAECQFKWILWGLHNPSPYEFFTQDLLEPALREYEKRIYKTL